MKQGRWTAVILGAAFALSMTGCEENITDDSSTSGKETTECMQTELFTDSADAEVTAASGDFAPDSSVDVQLFAETTKPEESAADTVTQTDAGNENAVTSAAAADSETDGSATVFSRTSGIWKTTDTAEIVTLEMDGNGAFNAYAEDGSLLYQGNIKTVDEYGDGSYRYDLYDDGALVMGFYFDTDTQIHIGNAGTVTYTKQ